MPPPLEAGVLLARPAYWHARVRLLQGAADAVTEFEAVLRTLGGSPQATAWFVDLLWRAGRVDRAEQVWKSVRGNRRVLGCDEGPLLEARSFLRRGEAGPAERVLQESAPASGVAWDGGDARGLRAGPARAWSGRPARSAGDRRG